MNPRTLIIAEAGINHNGDINKAKLLIDAAVYAKVEEYSTENIVEMYTNVLSRIHSK